VSGHGESELDGTAAGNRDAMISSRAGKPRSSSRVGVAWSDGLIRLRDPELFGNRADDLCFTFVRHVFALEEVKCVEIDRDRSTAQIRHRPGRSGPTDLLKRLSDAIRGKVPPSDAAFADSTVAQEFSRCGGRTQIRRFGAILTTWEIVSHQPGRIRLRHDAIRGDAVLASRILDVIQHVPGVLDCKTSATTGTVLVRFDPSLTSVSRLLQILERARHTPAVTEVEPACPKPVAFGLANTSVVLAAATELVAPALLPVCAIVLVGSNLQTFRAAGKQLLERRLGLPVLYTSIVAAALATGQFVACAAMNWMLTFWRYRYRIELTTARRRLLGDLIQPPAYARLSRAQPDGVDVEVPLEDLKPNNVIVVSAGEQIPVDGLILRGRGLIDERTVRGLDGLARKQADDEVFAGCTLRLGELHIETRRLGAQTRAAALARVIQSAIATPHGSRTPSARGEMFAERTVAPTMAAAGLGFLLGDTSTAVAILQPDYASGPGLAFPLETLQAIALCIRHGIVIRNAAAIEQLASADLVFLDHHPSLERTELEIDSIHVFPSHSEEDLLRYAAAAFHGLEDDRALALARACRARGTTPHPLEPIEIATDITLQSGQDRIKVGDLGARAGVTAKTPKYADLCGSESEPPDSLMVGINGRVAGLIHFRRSGRLEAASVLRRLRARWNLQICVVSDQPHRALGPLAAALDADFHLGGQSPEERIRFLQHSRRRGLKVAYVGHSSADPRIAAEAHIAISLLGDELREMDQDLAPIWLLKPRLTHLVELWDIAHIHQRRLKTAHRLAVIPNLLCVAGAFVASFTSLASVVVTNLGTYGVYSRTIASMRSLERQISKPWCTRPFAARGKP
jgi:cation transport ATPase